MKYGIYLSGVALLISQTTPSQAAWGNNHGNRHSNLGAANQNTTGASIRKKGPKTIQVRFVPQTADIDRVDIHYTVQGDPDGQQNKVMKKIAGSFFITINLHPHSPENAEIKYWFTHITRTGVGTDLPPTQYTMNSPNNPEGGGGGGGGADGPTSTEVFKEDFSSPSYHGTPLAQNIYGRSYTMPNEKYWSLGKDGFGGGNNEDEYYNDNSVPGDFPHGLGIPHAVRPSRPSVYIGADAKTGQNALIIEAVKAAPGNEPQSLQMDSYLSRTPNAAELAKLKQGDPRDYSWVTHNETLHRPAPWLHPWNRHWYSGKVHSKGKFNFRYGQIDVEARIPTGKGTWAAIWMLPQAMDDQNPDAAAAKTIKTWPVLGEIDLMEYIGANPKPTEIVGSLNYGDWVPGAKYTTQNVATLDGSSFEDNYHTFSVVWEQGSIKWLVDGRQYASRTSNNTVIPAPSKIDNKGGLGNCQSYPETDVALTHLPNGQAAPAKCLCSLDKDAHPRSPDVCHWHFDDGPQYVILNLAVGGMLGGVTTSTPDGVKMYIKSVKVKNLGHTTLGGSSQGH